MRRIILFKKALTEEGGAERLMLEVARWFSSFGWEVLVVATAGKKMEKFFGGAYRDVTVKTFQEGDYPANFFGRVGVSFTSLGKFRKEIKSFQPEIILGQNPADAEIIYLASIGLKIPFAVFLYASFFNFPDDGLKYLSPFRRVFEKVRSKTPGHRTFIPSKNPVKGFLNFLVLQCRAWTNYFVVRHAACAFSMTRRMAWENSELYGRPVIDIKGGVKLSLFGYKAKKDMRAKFGFPADAKMLIDVSRLIVGKRIDLCLQTVAELSKKRNDIYFVVGGKGPDKEKLEKLIDELGLQGRVVLPGFIAEDDLLDFYASASLVFHPAWIDFDLTVMEGLSLGKKIVCSTDYDLSEDLGALKGKLLFEAEPDAISMAEAVEKALAAAPVPTVEVESILKKFTWEAYSRNLANHLSNVIEQ